MGKNKTIENTTLFERYRLLAEKGYFVNIEIIGKDENSLGKVSYTGYVSDENGDIIEDLSSCDDFEEAFKQAIELVEAKLTKKESIANKKKSDKEIAIIMGEMCSICKKSNCHHWNAKVKCIESFSCYFIKGNIYNVMYGQLESELRYSVHRYKNIEEINERHISKFEEIKEEK